MENIGKGIAMAGLFIAAAIVQINGEDASILWIVAIAWLIFGEWSSRSTDAGANEERKDQRAHMERMIAQLPQAERAAFLGQYLGEII